MYSPSSHKKKEKESDLRERERLLKREREREKEEEGRKRKDLGFVVACGSWISCQLLDIDSTIQTR